jgi:CheY-like chemotaxis protein
MQVVVVDDDSALRAVFGALLRELGCDEARFVSYDSLMTSEEVPEPDLIVLDLEPSHDECARRQLGRRRTAPIVTVEAGEYETLAVKFINRRETP